MLRAISPKLLHLFLLLLPLVPLHNNDTPEHRRLNRRVDIVVVWQ